jgi:hypothetical protein
MKLTFHLIRIFLVIALSTYGLVLCDFSPNPGGQKIAQAREVSHHQIPPTDITTKAPPQATDTLFVADHGQDLDLNINGTINVTRQFQILIDRYFSDSTSSAVIKGVLPAKSTLVLIELSKTNGTVIRPRQV